MIIKIKSCLYCEQEMETITVKKRFCSDKCRVYYNRENKYYKGGFVYCLKNPLENNKIFYIGKTTTSLNKRLKDHLNNDGNKEKDDIIKLILNAKENVIIEQVEFVDDILMLDEREKYWIKEFCENGLSNHSLNPKKGKSNPIGVRFDLNKMEMIQKEQNLTSAQSVLNYLMDNYGKTETKRGAPFKNMPPYDRNSPKSEVSSKLEQIPVENHKTPQKGLKGIDLVIWKSENGI
jgi:predicted GIY-YIG superfamily endonuclease